jgi:hypothetical protein
MGPGMRWIELRIGQSPTRFVVSLARVRASESGIRSRRGNAQGAG